MLDHPCRHAGAVGAPAVADKAVIAIQVTNVHCTGLEAASKVSIAAADRRPHGYSKPLASSQYCLLSGASMPLKRIRCPCTSIVLPSMTDATPVIGSGCFVPIKFCRLISCKLSACFMAVSAASAPAAATVTRIKRSGTLAQRRSRERLAPECLPLVRPIVVP
ncbi:hypothetical protein [Mesorhizobium captivum]|uniref:hypothetical protein n=1 Tax=Mesorhizobium captivum TaxID=3072319 RepID=UPI002A239B26|nr:hypothetical protein [Mesorhizobium sp. VK22E]MDX8508576.1 hypothetical protein [Mesorhizobium sp. VK22E]